MYEYEAELDELHKYYSMFNRAYVVMLNDQKYFALKDFCFMQVFGRHYTSDIIKAKDYPRIRDYFKELWMKGVTE